MTATIPEQVRTTLMDRIPFKRWADPGEIAAVHAFLASDDASYITGQVIFADYFKQLPPGKLLGCWICVLNSAIFIRNNNSFAHAF